VVDPSGGVVLAGQSPTGFSTAFVRRLGPDGTLLWAASFGPLGASIEVTDVAVADGAIYVVGRIAGAFPGYTSAGGFDSFLVRLHPDDGALVWAQQWGSAGDDTARALAVRGDGRVFVLGDAPVAAAGVQAFGGVDAFVLQSDATGQVATLHALGTALADRAYGLDFDEGGDLLVMLATFGMLQGSGSAASGHVFARLPTLEFP
jgi:outer membrane protein assembly factor BamB